MVIWDLVNLGQLNHVNLVITLHDKIMSDYIEICKPIQMFALGVSKLQKVENDKTKWFIYRHLNLRQALRIFFIGGIFLKARLQCLGNFRTRRQQRRPGRQQVKQHVLQRLLLSASSSSPSPASSSPSPPSPSPFCPSSPDFFLVGVSSGVSS